MTTTWKPDGSWAGETVAVLASGPGMSEAVAQELSGHRVIVVNYTLRAAPWADMLVAIDGHWPQEFRDFAGLRVTSLADATLDALCYPMPDEQVTVGRARISFRNSGLAAIRIAADMGAARIILAGYQPEDKRHWYEAGEAAGSYLGVREGLDKIAAELRARGVTVEFHAESCGG